VETGHVAKAAYARLIPGVDKLPRMDSSLNKKHNPLDSVMQRDFSRQLRLGDTNTVSS
jgi:hypothetical protein